MDHARLTFGSGLMRHTRSLLALSCLLSALMVASLMLPAHAYNWPRRLGPGRTGKAVKALQARVAGWFPSKTRFHIDGIYGRQTKKAVRNFRDRYGLPVSGRAGRLVFKRLNWLESRDKSTRHFNWGEFDQNFNSACGAQANAFAGSFGGGRIARKRVRHNVHRMMWRLEAVRKKGGRNPIGINSGFRSVPYNSCIGGASASQHMYGTAADNRLANRTNHRARVIARRSQISGIGCYSNSTHNHFDLRVENKHLPSQRGRWWPRRDSQGRDLAANGVPCFGYGRSLTAAGSMLWSKVLSDSEVGVFASKGEGKDLGRAD
jgi:zinc D-Ala-D-Ala carboxypeptidase